MRAPRRPQVLAKQRNSRGSGPAGPENFGYFPSLESSPPAGGTSPKKRNRDFAAAAATYFAYSGKVGKTPLGGNGFWEGPAANALVFQESHPRTPFFTGEPEGCVGSCVRRGNLLNGVYAYLLPLCSVDGTGASTR